MLHFNLWFQQAADLMNEAWWYAPQGALFDVIMYNVAVHYLVRRARRSQSSSRS